MALNPSSNMSNAKVPLAYRLALLLAFLLLVVAALAHLVPMPFDLSSVMLGITLISIILAILGWQVVIQRHKEASHWHHLFCRLKEIQPKVEEKLRWYLVTFDHAELRRHQNDPLEGTMLLPASSGLPCFDALKRLAADKLKCKDDYQNIVIVNIEEKTASDINAMDGATLEHYFGDTVSTEQRV